MVHRTIRLRDWQNPAYANGVNIVIGKTAASRLMADSSNTILVLYYCCA
jgi:hypothetical protein